MTINSIGSSSSSSALQAVAARAGGHRPGGGVIGVAAKALGLSPEKVIGRLKDGESLGDLADEQGVSRDDLAAALKAGAPPGLAASGRLDEVVSSMIDQVGLPAGGTRGPRPGPPPGQVGGPAAVGAS